MAFAITPYGRNIMSLNEMRVNFCIASAFIIAIAVTLNKGK